ncbi:MAG: hypothetical protein K1X54_00795 [Flavobacteriales bacterium]|nr:hypothetical protein [Flavobacteriales bacterium]
MNKLTLVLLFLMPLGFSAQKWIPCVVDSSISIELTEGYKLSETDNKLMYLSLFDNASAVVIKSMPEPKDTTLFNLENLRRSYRNFEQEMLQKMGGVLLSEDEVNLQGVVAFKFRIKATQDGQAQIIHFAIIHLRTGFYVMRFSELESASETQKLNRETFFNSLKIQASARTQFPEADDPKADLGYRIGYIIGENLIWVLLVTLFLIVSIRSFRKSKNTMT